MVITPVTIVYHGLIRLYRYDGDPINYGYIVPAQEFDAKRTVKKKTRAKARRSLR